MAILVHASQITFHIRLKKCHSGLGQCVPSFENCCETLPYGHLNNKILLYGNLVICGGVLLSG